MLLRPDSYKKGIIRSTLFNILAKGLGFVNSLIIIFIFGSGIKTDLYFVILSTGLVVTTFINSIDSLVVIPEAMRLRAVKGEQVERRFLNFFVWTYFGIGLLLVAAVFIFPTSYYSFFSKYDDEFLSSELTLLRLSALLPPIQLITNLFVSILASYRYFTTPMIVGLVNSLISITTLLIIRDQFSVLGALAAIVAGNSLNLVWIIWHFRKRLNWHFFARPTWPARKLVQNIGMMQLNILPLSIRNFATVYFVSGLGAGVVTSLNYGQQIALIPELLVITQIMTVSGIKFNELSANHNHAGLNDFFQQMQSFLLFVALPLGLLMMLTSDEIVNLLFFFSSRIDDQSASTIAMVMAFIGLTLPARALDMCMTKFIMGQQKIRQSVLYGILTQVFITALTITGVVTGGILGFLIANFAGYCIVLPLVYLVLLRRIAPFIQYRSWLKRSVPFVLFNLALAGGLYLVKEQFLLELPSLFVCAVIGISYIGILFAVNNKILNYVPASELLRKLILRR